MNNHTDPLDPQAGKAPGQSELSPHQPHVATNTKQTFAVTLSRTDFCHAIVHVVATNALDAERLAEEAAENLDDNAWSFPTVEFAVLETASTDEEAESDDSLGPWSLPGVGQPPAEGGQD